MILIIENNQTECLCGVIFTNILVIFIIILFETVFFVGVAFSIILELKNLVIFLIDFFFFAQIISTQ